MLRFPRKTSLYILEYCFWTLYAADNAHQLLRLRTTFVPQNGYKSDDDLSITVVCDFDKTTSPNARDYPWVLTVRKCWRRHCLVPFHSYTTPWRSIDNGRRLDRKVLSFVLSRRFINTIMNHRLIISTHQTLINVRWLNTIFVLCSCSDWFLETNTSERQLMCVIRIML